MRLAITLLLLASATVAFASNPGEPLDCSDWAFLEPGIGCQNRARDTECGASPFCAKAMSLVAMDNDGQFLALRRTAALPACGGLALFRYELIRSDGPELSEQVVGRIDERCVSAAESKGDVLITVLDPNATGDALSFLTFDRNSGTVLIPLVSRCQQDGGGGQRISCAAGFYSEEWLVALTGFATTFEILQTYEPPATLSFRVPYMPEGYQYADWFDTYYGDLATVGDWSQAQPLQCSYPASAPSVGDYLAVGDPLPTPAAGQGRYYVTAVSHQGRRRYGRQASSGVLSGRDPSSLPACE